MPDWLGQRAVRHAGELALLADGVEWTFAELSRRVGVAAGRLAKLGVEKGDRVALLARNSPEFVVAVHAVGRLGAVLVPLNVRLTAAELAWQLADSEATLLLHDAENRDLALEAVARTTGFRTAELCDDERDDAIPARDQIDLSDTQGIIYTSGTTGRPKGALLTYGNFWWSAAGSALHLGHRPDDRWLAALPLFHVGGLSILFRSVIGGIPIVLHDGFDPARVNRAIEEQRITLISVVANMLRRMIDERAGQPYPPSLRCVLLGGGPAPRPLLEDCLRLGVPVAPTYGLTESCSQAATLLPEELADYLGTAGRALPVTDIAIERDGCRLPDGEVGEIVLRGPTVSPGYLNREAVGPDGWLRTGDLGSLDEAGYLTVLDRRDDLIVSGGENVYPAEVEAALLAHPEVEEAAVVGEPDEQWGAVPVAFVKRREGAELTGAELLDFCSARLANYKRPRYIEWVEVMPRNAGGKVVRRELRRRD